MALTTRQIEILTALRRYFYLRTADVRDIVVPADKDGSITRECMRALLKLGYVRRHEPRLLEQGRTTVPPIFVLTLSGSCALATATGDVGKILTVEPTFRDWMSLHHYLALSRLHWTIDRAFKAQKHVRQHALYFEHEVIRPDAQAGARYRLHTPIDDKVLCCPDSAFETEVFSKRRAWFVEREMGSDTPGRVVAKKHKGHAGMARAQLFKRFFPEASDMRVLAVCPNPGWRDALREAFKERKGDEVKLKDGAALWLFVAVQDLTVENFLHGPICYTVEKGPLPFAPNPPDSPAQTPAAGANGGASAGGGLYV